MKTRITTIGLLVCFFASAGDLYQHWSIKWRSGGVLEAYADNITVTGSAITGSSQSEHYIVLSLSTLAYDVHGFTYDIAILMDDGSTPSFYCANLKAPKTPGMPAVVRIPTGQARPVKIVHFSVQPLITDYAAELVN